MEQGQEVVALLVFAAVGLLPAAVIFARYRDFFDPSVIFPLSYVFLTAGPVVWWMYSGEFHPGMYRPAVSPALFAAASGIGMFHIGASLAMGSRSELRRIPVTSIGDAWGARYARPLAAIVAFAFLAINGYLAWKIRSAAPEIVGKSALLSSTDPGLISQYRFSQATVIPTATLFVVADSVVSRGKLTFGAFAYFAVHCGVCFITGERDVALVAAAWVACNVHQWDRRFLLTVVSALVVLVAVVPMIRAASGQEFGLDDIAQSLLTRNSSNLLVFTNVTHWVPEEQPFWYGESYLDSILNLIPGVPIGETLIAWFKRNYEFQGRSGFAFSMDAEAYVNFGWIGPAIVFCVWGMALGFLFRQSKKRPSVNTVFLWVLTLTSSIFAIRAFSLPLIKMAVYGAIGSRLLWFVAHASDQVRRRRVPARRRSRSLARRNRERPIDPNDPGLA